MGVAFEKRHVIFCPKLPVSPVNMESWVKESTPKNSYSMDGVFIYTRKVSSKSGTFHRERKFEEKLASIDDL